MKLVRKLSLAISLGVCVVLGTRVWMRLNEEREDFRVDVQRDHEALGWALGTAVEARFERAGKAGALQLVERFNRARRGIEIRLVFDDGTEDAHRPRARAHAGEIGAAFRFRLLQGGAVPAMLSYTPVRLSHLNGAAIELYEELHAEKQVLDRFVDRMVVTTGVLVGLCSIIIYGFGVMFVARPLRTLTAKAERIGNGDLSGPVIVPQRDEIRGLAQALNDMCDRLREARERGEAEAQAKMNALTELRHADRLRTVGELASGIAHQVGTPLNVIRGRGAMIGRGEVNEPRMRELGSIIVDQADRVSATIRGLLDFARRQQPDLTPSDVNQLLEDSVMLVEPLANERHVRLELTKLPEPLTLSLDAGQLHQALTNLLVNAVHASPPGKVVTITVQTTQTEVIISVVDRGRGVAADQLPHIFEPFFTTKRAGDGTGLGLSVADGIVREHGGTISVHSVFGQGATFSVHLPRRSPGDAQAGKKSATR